MLLQNHDSFQLNVCTVAQCDDAASYLLLSDQILEGIYKDKKSLRVLLNGFNYEGRLRRFSSVEGGFIFMDWNEP